MRNQALLHNRLGQLYDPSIPNYRHFLTVPQCRFRCFENTHSARCAWRREMLSSPKSYVRLGQLAVFPRLSGCGGGGSTSSTTSPPAVHNKWAWMDGTAQADFPARYGTPGAPSSENFPGRATRASRRTDGGVAAAVCGKHLIPCATRRISTGPQSPRLPCRGDRGGACIPSAIPTARESRRSVLRRAR